MVALRSCAPDTGLSELEARLARAEARAARERAARLAAEAIAEQGLRDLYATQQHLLLLQRITEGANRDSDVHAAFRLALAEMCGHMGWIFGKAYLRGPGNVLEPCDTWLADREEDLLSFVELSRDLRFPAGRGLSGRVLADRGSHWIADMAADDDRPRAAAALRCGLRAGCAFPVMIGDEVAAVIELFSRQPQEPDERLTALMSQVGTQLGRVIERDRARRALLHDTRHDAMTGLPNRTCFTDRLRAAFQHFRARPDRALAVMVIDFDNLKAVNDRLGHHAGDRLLIAMARRLEQCLRRAIERCAPADAMLARMGGDEFTVLMDGASPDETETLAADIHAALAGTTDEEDGYLSTTASIGIAHAHVDHEAVDQLLRDADLAMYEAKARGRNRSVTLSAALALRLRRRLGLEHELREALARQEFVLHYQPIVALDDPDRVRGYEALVRWQHPALGLIGPDEFVDLAERTGLILLLGDWVLREACFTMARLHDACPADARPFVSINISPRQFHQPEFAQRVAVVLQETGLEAAAVRLEITENVALGDAMRTRAALDEIRATGVRTSLDDFGTGYSSLSHLQQLPFDALKIDRSFVAALEQEGSGHSIMRTIVELARSLDMRTIAEGVETQAQARLLRRLGCTYGQGYLFGRPMPEDIAFKAVMPPLTMSWQSGDAATA